MPDFEDAWLELQGQDVRFLGLFVPKGLDSEQDARDFIEELGLTYDIATDVRAEIAEAYELKFYPTTIFIDKSGRVYSTEISVLDQEKITRIVGEMTQG
jgi:peroxiredoxin